MSDDFKVPGTEQPVGEQSVVGSIIFTAIFMLGLLAVSAVALYKMAPPLVMVAGAPWTGTAEATVTDRYIATSTKTRRTGTGTRRRSTTTTLVIEYRFGVHSEEYTGTYRVDAAEGRAGMAVSRGGTTSYRESDRPNASFAEAHEQIKKGDRIMVHYFQPLPSWNFFKPVGGYVLSLLFTLLGLVTLVAALWLPFGLRRNIRKYREAQRKRGIFTS
jgi:hypothetical protein